MYGILEFLFGFKVLRSSLWHTPHTASRVRLSTAKHYIGALSERVFAYHVGDWPISSCYCRGRPQHKRPLCVPLQGYQLVIALSQRLGLALFRLPLLQ